MNWKIFITAFISIISIGLPANIIGCGPDADPYDYYTSFFHQELSNVKGFRPFYYTSYNFLYDENESESPVDVLAKEWAAYCGKPVTKQDAMAFVLSYSPARIDSLYQISLNKKRNKKKVGATGNSMEEHFLQHKDPEALRYIGFARRAEPYVIGGPDDWQAVVRDSVAMDKLIKEGQQLLGDTKDDFFKLKYGYQVVRLAHYSKRYPDAINWYDTYIAGNKTKSVLQAMSLALKAGALARIGNDKEAAYLFSKAFSETEVRRISNYYGFKWSTSSGDAPDLYLNLCKTNTEKANMNVLFSFGDTRYGLASLEKVYQLDPGNNVLAVLAVREVNKFEETYLSPKLAEQPGGMQFFFSWSERPNEDALSNEAKKGRDLANFLHVVSQNKKTVEPAVFETAAAYIYMMIQDYANAKKYLDAAEKMQAGNKVKDQILLTKLLLAINSTTNIDTTFENEVLPSILWLQGKAEAERKDNAQSYRQWTLFYRNLMGSVLAKRYHEQKEFHKEVLSVGAADRISQDTENYYSYTAINFLHNNLVSKDVEKLYKLMNNKGRSSFEDYLINFNSIKIKEVVDFAGTAYLRDYDFSDALKWFKKDADAEKNIIGKNPFIELLYDQETQLPIEKSTTTKPTFAKEMLRLESLLKSDKKNAEKYYYKMALGFYNITYYGYAWELVEYWRTGSDGYNIPEAANGFQKEYFGCFKAHYYFKKAMTASTDKNFKAKCLFMMAKCTQKQVQKPGYSDFPGDYTKYDDAVKKYNEQFRANKYFPQFIRDYKSTPFYKEAFNSCSYLRDFVKSK